QFRELGAVFLGRPRREPVLPGAPDPPHVVFVGPATLRALIARLTGLGPVGKECTFVESHPMILQELPPEGGSPRLPHDDRTKWPVVDVPKRDGPVVALDHQSTLCCARRRRAVPQGRRSSRAALRQPLVVNSAAVRGRRGAGRSPAVEDLNLVE